MFYIYIWIYLCVLLSGYNDTLWFANPDLYYKPKSCPLSRCYNLLEVTNEKNVTMSLNFNIDVMFQRKNETENEIVPFVQLCFSSNLPHTGSARARGPPHEIDALCLNIKSSVSNRAPVTFVIRPIHNRMLRWKWDFLLLLNCRRLDRKQECHREHKRVLSYDPTFKFRNDHMLSKDYFANYSSVKYWNKLDRNANDRTIKISISSYFKNCAYEV